VRIFSQSQLEHLVEEIRRQLVCDAGSAGFAPLARWTDENPTQARLDLALLQRAHQLIRELASASVAGDAAILSDAARQLAGLGPGSTPSGDDFLAGFLALLWVARRGVVLAGWPDYDKVAGLILQAARERTDSASFAWLTGAARGEVSEAVKILLETLEEPVIAHRLKRSAAAVLAQGATSGADTLLGMMVGGQVLLASGNKTGGSGATSNTVRHPSESAASRPA
jgi:hypothetical protein